METFFMWVGIITVSYLITYYGMTPVRYANKERAEYVKKMEKLVSEGKARRVEVRR